MKPEIVQEPMSSVRGPKFWTSLPPEKRTKYVQRAAGRHIPHTAWMDWDDVPGELRGPVRDLILETEGSLDETADTGALPFEVLPVTAGVPQKQKDRQAKRDRGRPDHDWRHVAPYGLQKGRLHVERGQSRIVKDPVTGKRYRLMYGEFSEDLTSDIRIKNPDGTAYTGPSKTKPEPKPEAEPTAPSEPKPKLSKALLEAVGGAVAARLDANKATEQVEVVREAKADWSKRRYENRLRKGEKPPSVEDALSDEVGIQASAAERRLETISLAEKEFSSLDKQENTEVAATQERLDARTAVDAKALAQSVLGVAARTQLQLLEDGKEPTTEDLLGLARRALVHIGKVAFLIPICQHKKFVETLQQGSADALDLRAARVQMSRAQGVRKRSARERAEELVDKLVAEGVAKAEAAELE